MSAHEDCGDSAFTRRRQRRPNLQNEFSIPSELIDKLQRALHSLRELTSAAVAAPTDKNNKAMKAVCEALQWIAEEARTPELQLRAVSKITGSLRECAFAQVQTSSAIEMSAGEHDFMRTLVAEFIFPFLLDCRVRYLHRALATLLRSTCVLTEEIQRTFKTKFLQALVRCWGLDADGRPCLFSEEAGNRLATSQSQRVLTFLNSVDGLSSTVMPLMPQVFRDTFTEVLPLLGDSLQWTVGNALSHRQFASTPRTQGNIDGDEGAVFGEDLDLIRFSVRVVATYTHKYMDSLNAAFWQLDASSTKGNEADISDVVRDLSRLMQPAFQMLSLSVFPKDVLNATGLLVASILTVRTVDPWLLTMVCHSICSSATTDGKNTFADGEGKHPAADPLSGQGAQVRDAMRIICAAEPEVTAKQESSVMSRAEAKPSCLVDSLQSLFEHITNNGRFALLKGILAHLSTPVRGDAHTIGVLLIPRLFDNGAQTVVVVYDMIVPAAEAFSAAIEDPETRFMAIQTIDSVIRHISASLAFVVHAVGREEGTRPSLLKCKDAERKLKKSRKEAHSSDTARTFTKMPVFCQPCAKLRRTLNMATQLVMGLWDDGTQQVFAALYSTYNEILDVNELLKQCKQLYDSGDGGASDCTYLSNQDHAAGFIDTAETLYGILGVQNERRGKYHALLGLMSVMPLAHFVEMLRKFYVPTMPDSGVTTSIAAVSAFSHMLLRGASNHKIGNVAGEVFGKMARLLQGMVADTNASLLVHRDDLIREGIIAPLASAIALRSYTTVASNVSEPVSITNIVAHFATALLKQERVYLAALLDAIVRRRNTDNHGRVCQGVVEVLSRARAVGIDIATYLKPGEDALRIVLESMQALNYDLRNTAFGLCVLCPKKVECVNAWQCAVVEEYLSLNMHLGGDSVAQKSLLESFKKWVRRLSESYTSQGNKLDRSSAARHVKTAAMDRNTNNADERIEVEKEAVARSSAYQSLVLAHYLRLARLLATHIGTSVAFSDGLSIERRVAATACYIILVRGATEALSPPSINAHSAELFCPSVVEPLLADLSEGWSQARACARDLLLLFCQLAPSVVRRSTASVEDAIAVANAEIRVAQSYRKAEGAVQRFMLWTTQIKSAEADDVSASGDAGPHSESARLLHIFEAKQAAIAEACAAMEGLRGKDAFQFILSNPLHGSLSLCTALLVYIAGVRGHAVELHRAASNEMLRCSMRVMQVCGSLVGTEAEVATDELVDCRGHVYDKDDPNAEATMRAVVNNTWLNVRVATLSVQAILRLHKVDQLCLETVRGVCFGLVHALLLTKHNGVMRSVRAALKTMVEALVRSRVAQFYHVPSELLSYLLGSEGVTSSDISRMLRRSQGLPHAILAVLEGEDPSVPLSLFPITLTKLLQVARGRPSDLSRSAAEPNVKDKQQQSNEVADVLLSQQANALNVLKFIFEDKVFADRTVAYIEDAFSIATEGFNHSSWYIRNSSLMLFSSVLQRFVGEHPSTGGAGVNTSLHDIARRTPRGVAFAYRELCIGAGEADLQQTPVTGASAAVPNLALFPILQMLSMLAPDPPHLTTNTTNGVVDDSAAMIEVVRRCAGTKNLMVRSASAGALVCLVPPSAVTDVIQQTCRHVQSEPFRRHLNVLHGALLQLQKFHSHYVGTLQRHGKHRLSSSASPRLAFDITRTLITALVEVQEVLFSSSSVCPTVAAAFFTLAADVVFFCDSRDEAQTGEVVTLVTTAIRVLHRVVTRPTAAFSCMRADHGSTYSAAAVFLLVALRYEKLHEVALPQAVHRALTDVVQYEGSRLSIQTGMRNLITQLAEHLMFFSTTRPIFALDDVDHVVRLLMQRYSCDITTALLKSLEDVFATAARRPGSEVAGRDSTATAMKLGCESWEALAAHLNFIGSPVFAHHVFSPDAERRAAQLEQTLLQLLLPTGPASIPNAEVLRAGVQYLSSRYLKRQWFPREYAEMLAYHSLPEQPSMMREAVITALHGYFRSAVADATIRAPLLLILLRLLFDDLFHIREEACRVCSCLVAGAAMADKDQMTCVLSLVLILRRHVHDGSLTLEEAATYFSLSVDASAAENGENEEGCVDDDAAGEDDEEVLFQKESDNMFVEKTFVAYLKNAIFSCGSPGGPTFEVYDELLRQATACGSPQVTIGRTQSRNADILTEQ